MVGGAFRVVPIIRSCPLILDAQCYRNPFNKKTDTKSHNDSILVQWWHHCYIICHLKYWKCMWKLEDKLKHDLKIVITSAMTTDGCYSKDQDSCGTNIVDTVKDWQFYSKVLHTRTVSESHTCECLYVHLEVQGTAFNSDINKKYRQLPLTVPRTWLKKDSVISHATKHINAIVKFCSGS